MPLVLRISNVSHEKTQHANGGYPGLNLYRRLRRNVCLLPPGQLSPQHLMLSEAPIFLFSPSAPPTLSTYPFMVRPSFHNPFVSTLTET